MPSNRFRSTTFAEAGLALGKGLSGFRAALEAIGERNALEQENLLFGEFATELNRLSQSNDVGGFQSLLVQAGVTLQNPTLRQSIFRLGSSIAPKSKREVALEEELLKKRELETGISISDLEESQTTKSIEAKAFAREQELAKNAFNLKKAQQDLDSATTRAETAKINANIAELKQEALLSPDDSIDRDIAKKILLHPEDYTLDQVNNALDVVGENDPIVRKISTDVAGRDIVTEQDKVDRRTLFDPRTTQDSKQDAGRRLGVKDVGFVTNPAKPTLVEGREQISVDLGDLTGIESLRGEIRSASRNTIIDRIIVLQERLVGGFGIVKLSEEEERLVKESIKSMSLAIGTPTSIDISVEDYIRGFRSNP